MVSGGHPPAKLPEGKKGDARDQAGKDLLNHSRILQVLLNGLAGAFEQKVTVLL